MLQDLWTGLLDLVYPPKCLVCGDIQPKYLCDECLSDITMIRPPFCRLCGAPLQDGRCVDCSGIEFAFDSARSVGVYEGPLKDAVHQLKYSGHRVLGPVLGAMLADYLKDQRDLLRRVDCVIPLPIHPSRLRTRGFNQSELLAAEIGHALALPVMPRVLARTRPTHPQVDLPIQKRRENVLGAFAVVREDAVVGRRVLLIDDVFTTGSTADSAARALRESGVREVHVLTLARSI